MDIQYLSVAHGGLTFFNVSGERGIVDSVVLTWDGWKTFVKKAGRKRKLTKKFLESRVREGSTIRLIYGTDLGGGVDGYLYVMDLGEGYEYTYALDFKELSILAREGVHSMKLGDFNKMASAGIRRLMETPPESTE